MPAYAQIWDTINGDVVWEGIGNAQTVSGAYTINYHAGKVQDYSIAVANGLAGKILPN